MNESIKKRSRIREIILPDLGDDDEDAQVVVTPRKNSKKKKLTTSQVQSMNPPTDHLETKKQIEELRDKFGSDWLNADGENIVKEVFPVSADEDTLRRKIFIEELNDDSVLSSTPKEGLSSRLEITEEHLNSTVDNYGTASERTVTSGTVTTDTEGTTTAGYESALSREEASDLTGLDFFRSQQSVEDEVPEDNEVEYLVEKLRGPRDETGQKLIVVVSDLSVKEKDPETRE